MAFDRFWGCKFDYWIINFKPAIQVEIKRNFKAQMSEINIEDCFDLVMNLVEQAGEVYYDEYKKRFLN